MQIVHSKTRLEVVIESFILSQFPFFPNEFNQIPSRRIFKHQIDVRSIFEVMPKLDDMWMVQLLVNSDLPLDVIEG